MTELRYTTTVDDAGQRLDRVLHQAAPEMSRAALQKAVQAGHCQVDGLPETRVNAKMRAGQTITLRLPETATTLQAEEGHLELLWQDEHMVVCNKPAGLTVHPCPSCPEQTLVQRLLGRFPQLGRIEGQRPGIVHRLDKDTSGILLVALTEQDRLVLSEAFAQRKVHKEYLALVKGTPSAEGECREPIGRHPTAKIKMAVVPESRGGRTAHTEWKTLWTAPDKRFSLLAVRIHTGRTHQIRVHMTHLGHPLLGDRLYAPKPIQALAPRQMLHAWRISFIHPATGDPMNFACPPPDDMLMAALQGCRRMRRVVVTGNPGSGKSAFSQCLADMAVPVFSADATVAALYAPRGEAAQWIGQIGGSGLLTPAGAVDKNALLEAMRSNPTLRRDVENMVHSMTHKALETFWIQQESLGVPLAVAEVPLYFETGWQNSFSPEPHVVGVRCSMPLRAQRIEVNRGWAQDKLEAIEGWQWTQDRKMAACNTVVDNEGSLESLCAHAREFLANMRAQDQKDEQALALRLARLWQ